MTEKRRTNEMCKVDVSVGTACGGDEVGKVEAQRPGAWSRPVVTVTPVEWAKAVREVAVDVTVTGRLRAQEARAVAEGEGAEDVEGVHAAGRKRLTGNSSFQYCRFAQNPCSRRHTLA